MINTALFILFSSACFDIIESSGTSNLASRHESGKNNKTLSLRSVTEHGQSQGKGGNRTRRTLQRRVNVIKDAKRNKANVKFLEDLIGGSDPTADMISLPDCGIAPGLENLSMEARLLASQHDRSFSHYRSIRKTILGSLEDKVMDKSPLCPYLRVLVMEQVLESDKMIASALSLRAHNIFDHHGKKLTAAEKLQKFAKSSLEFFVSHSLSKASIRSGQYPMSWISYKDNPLLPELSTLNVNEHARAVSLKLPDTVLSFYKSFVKDGTYENVFHFFADISLRTISKLRALGSTVDAVAKSYYLMAASILVGGQEGPQKQTLKESFEALQILAGQNDSNASEAAAAKAIMFEILVKMLHEYIDVPTQRSLPAAFPEAYQLRQTIDDLNLSIVSIDILLKVVRDWVPENQENATEWDVAWKRMRTIIQEELLALRAKRIDARQANVEKLALIRDAAKEDLKGSLAAVIGVFNVDPSVLKSIVSRVYEEDHGVPDVFQNNAKPIVIAHRQRPAKSTPVPIKVPPSFDSPLTTDPDHPKPESKAEENQQPSLSVELSLENKPESKALEAQNDPEVRTKSILEKKGTDAESLFLK